MLYQTDIKDSAVQDLKKLKQLSTLVHVSTQVLETPLNVQSNITPPLNKASIITIELIKFYFTLYQHKLNIIGFTKIQFIARL